MARNVRRCEARAYGALRLPGLARVPVLDSGMPLRRRSLEPRFRSGPLLALAASCSLGCPQLLSDEFMVLANPDQNGEDPPGSAGSTGASGSAGSAGNGGSGQAAAGSGGTGGSLVSVPGAPSVVSVSPSNGASGVAANAVITLTFSEPMDKSAVEGAYSSSTLPRGSVSFSWSGGDTVLQITPNQPLARATGSSPTTAARVYAFELGTAAVDLEGEALPRFSTSFTTLRELTQLARHILQTYPEQYRMYAQPEFEWNGILQRNRNPLLAFGADGLSTGFTEGSGYGIVASIERNGTRLILALGGIASDRERTEEATRVLDWGLTTFETRRLFAADEAIGGVSVYGGASGKVDLVSRDPVDIYVPVSNPERLSAKIVYRWPLNAPLDKGVNAGTLQIYSGERLLRDVPLYTAAAVATGTLRQRATDALLELMLFWL